MASDSRKKAMARKEILKGKEVFRALGGSTPSSPWSSVTVEAAISENKAPAETPMPTYATVSPASMAPVAELEEVVTPEVVAASANDWPDVFDVSPWCGNLSGASGGQTPPPAPMSVRVKSRNISEARPFEATQAEDADQEWSNSASDFLDSLETKPNKKH